MLFYWAWIQVDVEVDNDESKPEDDDVTQTAAQELVSAPPAKSVKVEPNEQPDRPNTANRLGCPQIFEIFL